MSGVSKDNVFTTKVVAETDVAETKNSFKEITDEFIYSVHLEASATWEEQVAQLDLRQFTQLLFDDKFIQKINSNHSFVTHLYFLFFIIINIFFRII